MSESQQSVFTRERHEHSKDHCVKLDETFDTRSDARFDAQGTLWPDLRRRFAPGAPDTLYFDANSIGPMPLDAPARMLAVLDQGWRLDRRRSWNNSDWLEQPRLLGASLARVLGAEVADVIVCDSTSVNQFKLLRHALSISQRHVIVAQSDVFPSNRYVAEGITRDAGTQLRLIDSIDDLEAALAHNDVAVVALSHVDYRSSERLDMAQINSLIHRYGALSLWDLSHSAGAINVALRESDTDLALGCGYKYLSGGPGAPSFIYVHPRHQQTAWPAICGWMGHADTFAFESTFEPAAGVARFLVGTPAVLANTAFAAAADIWQQVDPRALERRHGSLSGLLIELVEGCELGQHLQLASPREHRRRGGHVAFRFDGAQSLAQALVADGVVVSARKPDALRFGIHPLVTRHIDIWQAVQKLRAILASGCWQEPRFAGDQV